MTHELQPKTATTHTPGPWRVDPDLEHHPDYFFVDDGLTCADSSESGPDLIAKAYKCLEVGDGLANARLIAASPELLDSLNEVLRFVVATPDSMAAVAKAYNVLNKVRGEV